MPRSAIEAPPGATPDERRALGRELRDATPRSSFAEWIPAANRPDPVALIGEQDEHRLQDLVPVRHGRMRVSPFTFYRGAARVMAADLAPEPVSGLRAQICGDAHLSNFGVYSSPERALVFDLNDFDETLPGPWEWDLQRLVASIAIAGRHNGMSRKERERACLRATAAYREAMAGFADAGTLAIWYSRIDAEDIVRRAGDEKTRAGARKALDKARSRDSLQALAKLAETVDGTLRIATKPPIVVPLRDHPMAKGVDEARFREVLRTSFERYRATLAPDRRVLLDRFRIVDIAHKIVGVGSVGTICLIVLLVGRDDGDPLFLQAKQAGPSVLEAHLPKSRYRNPGQRVVEGQRLMQAASDIFLGWMKATGPGERTFYWRQLRDGKGAAVIENLGATTLADYAGLCGRTLARAHARSADPIAVSSYIGRSDTLDRSMAAFAERYADQNERDHEAFQQAVADGRLAAVDGL